MNKPISFGYICPIEFLDKFVPEESRFHLILAHLLRHPKYVEFYNKKADRGDMIILDNSAFEFGKPIETDELLELIDTSGIRPTHVVAPDYPCQHWRKTYESAVSFIEELDKRNRLDDFKVMAVPQSEVGMYSDWCHCYCALNELQFVDVIGMSILGIPNAFQSITGTTDIATNRIYASLFLKNQGFVTDKWHHYLGLGNGPRELVFQREIGIINSCDSSSPIWHGMHGISYDDSATGLKNGKIQLPVDFETTKNITTGFIECVRHNIDFIQSCIK